MKAVPQPEAQASPTPEPSIRQQITKLLSEWPLTPTGDLQLCTQGVDNYNYLLKASAGRFIVTRLRTANPKLFPRLELLLKHLKVAGLPVPQILTTHSGQPFVLHEGHPVIVQNCLPGTTISAPTAAQCQKVGALMADFHLATVDFADPEEDNWVEYCLSLTESYAPHLDSEERAVFAEEFNHLVSKRPKLPTGLLHNDFFCDNLLFDNANGDDEGDCTGLIDFYCMTTGEYIRDLAIALLDWAWNSDTGTYSPAHAQALLAGYQQNRPLSDSELRYLPDLIHATAVAMWLYRLERTARGTKLAPNRQPGDIYRRICALRATPPLPQT